MAHNQENGVIFGAFGPQGNNQNPSVLETNAALKSRLASIALERQEKLKEEVCKVIEGIEHTPSQT